MRSDLVYLVQTDTTVGFVSSDPKLLCAIKMRDPNQKVLQEVDSYSTLLRNTRVPNRFKKQVRRACKISLIYPNGLSFRVVDNRSFHHDFIKKFHALYSTSANQTSSRYQFDFAYGVSDVVVFNKKGFEEKQSSSILKLNNKKMKRIR